MADDRALHADRRGPRWLEDARIAGFLAGTILAGDLERRFYEFAAWAIMPNHVHMLILPLVPVPAIMRWIKGSTARRANQLLGRTGLPFWQEESYDHWVRGRREFDRIIKYIDNNPVAAGLVDSVGLWPWCGAAGLDRRNRLSHQEL